MSKDLDTFSWLHLSDFHHGLKGQRALWPTMRQAFLDSLSELHEFCGPWNTVFFTGDLAQSGAQGQFRAFQEEVLEPLWTHLDKLGSGAAVLLAVPGNHDLSRPDTKANSYDNPAVDALLRQDRFEDIAIQFWARPESSYRKAVQAVFSNYEDWWLKESRRASGIIHGALPGDFVVTLNCGARRVGVMGLNTAFLQLSEGDYKGKLEWSVEQVHELCKASGGVDRWQAQHDVCLLMTHHGPEWLTAAARAHGQCEVAPAGRFALHLFGHMHEEQLLNERRNGNPDAVVLCQSSSVFGMERFGNPPSVQRSHGYSSGRITLSAVEKPMFRLWPRVAVNGRGQAPWRFVSNNEFTLLSDQGTPAIPVAAGRRSTSVGAPTGNRVPPSALAQPSDMQRRQGIPIAQPALPQGEGDRQNQRTEILAQFQARLTSPGAMPPLVGAWAKRLAAQLTQYFQTASDVGNLSTETDILNCFQKAPPDEVYKLFIAITRSLEQPIQLSLSDKTWALELTVYAAICSIDVNAWLRHGFVSKRTGENDRYAGAVRHVPISRAKLALIATAGLSGIFMTPGGDERHPDFLELPSLLDSVAATDRLAMSLFAIVFHDNPAQAREQHDAPLTDYEKDALKAWLRRKRADKSFVGIFYRSFDALSDDQADHLSLELAELLALKGDQMIVRGVTSSVSDSSLMLAGTDLEARAVEYEIRTVLAQLGGDAPSPLVNAAEASEPGASR